MDSKSSRFTASPSRTGIGVALALFSAVLVVLFYGCFLPGHTLFSNDGPLATQVSACNRLPEGFTGSWQDLNTIGTRGGGGWPSVTYGLLFLLGPVGYAKFYAPIGLILLGLGAWCFFRQMGLTPLACILGGLAAMLNSIYFSTACWGVVAHPIAVGMSFLAMAALADNSPSRRWLRVALAGFAVGVAVADGADMGGIMSLFVAAYIMYRAWTAKGDTLPKNLGFGALRVALVAVCALMFAAQAATVLFGTQVQGVAGGGHERGIEGWDRATQWSLPKRETLSVLIPGLFGYRMDTPGGGNYWGAAGRDPNWDRYFQAAEGGPLQPNVVVALTFPNSSNLNTNQVVREDGKITLPGIGDVKARGLSTKQLASEIGQRLPGKEVEVSVQPPGQEAFLRYSGGGPYAGVLVVLVGIWAAAQTFRRRDPVFSPEHRTDLWFWCITAIIALLLAYGRYAPFYQFIYPLPFFSNIRNPAKFLHIFSLALIVLFAYGVDALNRVKLRKEALGIGGKSSPITNASTRPSAFDKAWIKGCFVAVIASLIAWAAYAYYQPSLETYLQTVGFDGAAAQAISGFSIHQLGWFILFLALAVALFTSVLGGRLAGPRAKVTAILMGTLLVLDLGRANLPWIQFVDYANKNEVASSDSAKSTNPVIEFLREQPYEHRVSLAPYNSGALNGVYRIGWMQHQFQYFNIQCLDIVQMPRAAEDFIAYQRAFGWDGTAAGTFRIARRWQMTNTRYLLGPAGALNDLNQQFDPVNHTFRIAARFNLGLKPGITQYTGQPEEITAVLDPAGSFAVFDYAGALPRAKVYTRWQVSTNDESTLKQLGSLEFDPQQTVLVDNAIPNSTASTNAGTVAFVSYAPKDIVFKAEAPAPAVLLLNDRFDGNWNVFVDGKPEPLLRCNYIMRGVQLPPGAHQVEFRFQPPVRALYVSLAATVAGLVLLGVLLFVKEPKPEPASPPAPTREKTRA